MLVHSKGDGEGKMIVVPAVGEEESKLNSQSKLNMVVLCEGWNDIDDDLWVKCHPHVLDKLESGELKLHCKEEKNESTGEITYKGLPLADVRADKAREIVRNTFNPKSLKEWNENPKLSSELRNLVDMQITAVEKGEDPKKK